MQKYIETRTAIQVRSHSQKFMMKLKKKFIELFGKEELISGDFDTQSKHIEYLLTNFFDCEFITNFLQKVAQAKTDDKVIEYIKQKQINFFKIIIALMNNSTIELYSRKIKYLNNSITNSPISTLSSSNDSSQSSPEPNEQFYIDYCAQESKDDLFKISFNELKQRKNNSSKNLLLELLDYNLMIVDLLEEKTEGIIMDSLYDDISLDRDKANIKLIKLLKKVSFDKDNKKIKNG